jgi:hypothetical protein
MGQFHPMAELLERVIPVVTSVLPWRGDEWAVCGRNHPRQCRATARRLSDIRLNSSGIAVWPTQGEDSVNRAAILRSAFPLTAKYDPQWVRENALGENALCQVESLARRLPLRAGDARPRS